jgi:nickel transport protein
MNAFFAYVAILILPGAAITHELDATVTFAPPAVIVRAAYGGTEPVAFAKVQVYSPSQAAQEYQTGVTDRRGNFSFVPDGPGAWRVVLDDEEGHRKQITVTISDPFQAAVADAPVSPPSRLERTILGLALIFGATGFFYGYKARSAGRRS